MAIVEAVSCGLQVVSTRVGGIPEVLPSNLIYLTDVTVDSLYNGVLQAIQNIYNERKIPRQNGQSNHATNSIKHTNGINHSIVAKSNHVHTKENKRKSSQATAVDENNGKRSVLCPYRCNEILRKLYNWEDVTCRTERVYRRVLKEKDPPFGEKLNCYLKTCMPFVLVVSFSYLLLKFLDIIEPRRFIDVAAEYPSNRKTQRDHPKNN